MTDQETPASTGAAETPEATSTAAEATIAAPGATPDAAPGAAPAPASSPAKGNWWWGTGRRKASVARVRIRPGKGEFVVNKRPYETFFTGDRDRRDLLNVLEKTRTMGTVDVHVNVRGGGYTGQAGAIILGLARALRLYDGSLEPILRDNNFLTRDPRKVERKKYGQPGARANFQFSKR